MRKRKNPDRSAKTLGKTRSVGLRRSQRGLTSCEQECALIERLKDQVHKKRARGAASLSRGRRSLGKLADYPLGSYGFARYLYLDGQLEDLGKNKKGLIDFTHASVEVDHAPHDGAQRGGLRQDDEALFYRPAMPLPWSVHRSHKTTHGNGAKRFDKTFYDSQRDLVQSGDYAAALKNHLLDTFEKDTIGQVGKKKINIMIDHAAYAVHYAASSKISTKIYKKHKQNEPTISAAEQTSIFAALDAKIAALETDLGLSTGNLKKPSTVAPTTRDSFI